MNKKKYLSRYSNGKEVSEAQYITEIICEKKAQINKEDLHYRFWISKKWSAFFRNQIATANKLLLKYDSQSIVAALLDVEAKKIFSLRAPHLVPIIERKQQELKNANSVLSKNIERKDNIIFNTIKANTNKNIISKLEDIDNGN